MKKILCLAVVATAFMGSPAFAKSQGLGIAANVLTGKGGVLGLLDGRSALVVNAGVTTGKGGVLGAVLARADCLVAACSAAAVAAATERPLQDGGRGAIPVRTSFCCLRLFALPCPCLSQMAKSVWSKTS